MTKYLTEITREERFISVHGFRNSSPSQRERHGGVGGRHGGVYVILSVEDANIIANGEAEWPGLGTGISFKDLPRVTYVLYLGSKVSTVPSQTPPPAGKQHSRHGPTGN